MGLKLPGIELAETFYRQLCEEGHGRAGHQALLVVLERMNNMEVKKY